jgi:hypothetical protein
MRLPRKFGPKRLHSPEDNPPHLRPSVKRPKGGSERKWIDRVRADVLMENKIEATFLQEIRES